MDIAYITRDGVAQEQLRYSIRSLANVTNFHPDVDTIWIVGHRPAWAMNVEYVPGNRMGSKGPNIFDNWRMFCEHADCDEFAAFNDDIYAMRPVAVAADEWQEPLTARVAREPDGWWRRSLAVTLDYCSTLTPEPRSYELHRPVLMNRLRLREALDKAAGSWAAGSEPPQWRSVYGNHWYTGRTRVADVKTKLSDPVNLAEPWVSTNPASWGGTPGRQVRSMFPDPSRFEEV